MSRECEISVICGRAVSDVIEQEIKKLPEWVGGHPLSKPERKSYSYPWDKETTYTYYKFDWCNHADDTSLFIKIKDLAEEVASDPEDFCKIAVLYEDNVTRLYDNSDGELEGLDITVVLPKPIQKETLAIEVYQSEFRCLVDGYKKLKNGLYAQIHDGEILYAKIIAE